MTNPDECKHYQRLLQTHRENYRVYEGQIITLGAFAPPYMHISLKEAQEGIIKCKKMLRQLGCPVKDELSDPDDEENGGSAPAQEPSTQRIDFAILTALEEEREAVLSKFPNKPKRIRPTNDDIHTYYQSTVSGEDDDGNAFSYNVVVTSLVGMGRVQASTTASAMIQRWKPRYLLLVGIAGGVEDKGVDLGDVLISEQVVDYELQKITADGPQIRWQTHRGDARLLSAIRNLSGGDWQQYIELDRPVDGKPKRHIGPVASGDKVVAFGSIMEQNRHHWPALIGVEMEAGGAATAAFQSAHQPGFFMIRGVSDFADVNKGKDDVEQWRGYACDVAAAFAYGLIASGLVPSES